ncbi:unnamed protein product [Parajaminaea phylloscopi]
MLSSAPRTPESSRVLRFLRDFTQQKCHAAWSSIDLDSDAQSAPPYASTGRADAANRVQTVMCGPLCEPSRAPFASLRVLCRVVGHQTILPGLPGHDGGSPPSQSTGLFVVGGTHLHRTASKDATRKPALAWFL